MQVEQFHLAAKFAVVALGGLFQHGLVGLQIVAVFEGKAVDALQHRAGGIAQPIGPRYVRQLERVGGHLAGVLQMRATAQVLPCAMPIHPQVFAFGNAVDEFDFKGFATLLVIGKRAGTVPCFGAHGVAGVDDLFHLGFNRA